MQPARIAALLSPFLGGASLSDSQLAQLASYLDLLLRWNARINLTAVRDPEQIVTRHFGESLFAARHLYPSCSLETGDWRLLDIGSGAGFPGLPIRIWAPVLRTTLLESNQRKATFLRDVVRALQLTGVEVLAIRAEAYAQQITNHQSPTTNENSVGPGALNRGPRQARVSPAGVVVGATLNRTESNVVRAPKPALSEAEGPATNLTITFRAVERFHQILPTAVELLQQFPTASRRLALLIGAAQVEPARAIASTLTWSDPLPIPASTQRVLLVGNSE